MTKLFFFFLLITGTLISVCTFRPQLVFAGDEKKEDKKEESKDSKDKDKDKKCTLSEDEKNKKLFSGDALPAECK